MADSKFTAEGAQALVDRTQEAHESCLELATLLDALQQPQDAPAWAWPLWRMAQRALELADLAQTEARRAQKAVEVAA